MLSGREAESERIRSGPRNLRDPGQVFVGLPGMVEIREHPDARLRHAGDTQVVDSHERPDPAADGDERHLANRDASRRHSLVGPPIGGLETGRQLPSRGRTLSGHARHGTHPLQAIRAASSRRPWQRHCLRRMGRRPADVCCVPGQLCPNAHIASTSAPPWSSALVGRPGNESGAPAPLARCGHRLRPSAQPGGSTEVAHLPAQPSTAQPLRRLRRCQSRLAAYLRTPLSADPAFLADDASARGRREVAGSTGPCGRRTGHPAEGGGVPDGRRAVTGSGGQSRSVRQCRWSTASGPAGRPAPPAQSPSALRRTASRCSSRVSGRPTRSVRRRG